MPEKLYRLHIGNLALTGHSGGEPGRHSGSDGGRMACSGHSPGWFWMPGGLAIDRPAPIFQGAALPGAVGDDPTALNYVLGVRFPDGAWDPLLRAATIAMALAGRLNWTTMQSVLDAEKAKFEKEIEKQLQQLWYKKIHEREERDQEVRAQAGDFTTYFADILGTSPASRPNTWTLVLVGLQLAGLITARFKLHYKMPRPAQVWPAIEPMIDTPPHPAFPSGHGMQAHLIARLIGHVVPAMQPVCENLADRITRNREVAGVHWPSDGNASKDLVTKHILDALATVAAEQGKDTDEAGVKEFRNVVVGAKAEWTVDGVIPKEGNAPPETAMDNEGKPVGIKPEPDILTRIVAAVEKIAASVPVAAPPSSPAKGGRKK